MSNRPHSFTKHDPDNYRSDPSFDHAVHFAVDKRDAGLIPQPNASGSNVRSVSDESPWENVAEMGAAIAFGRAPGALGVAVNSAYIRSAMRGEGRSRWR
jgi:hypothetical protein